LWPPSPDVPASGLGPDAGTFLHVGDRCAEVGRGVDQVVNQHVIFNSMQVAQAAPQGRAAAGLRPAIEGNHRWAPDPHQPYMELAAARCTPVPGSWPGRSV
jgi:hypothetical protein